MKIKITCKQCGKEFETYPSRIKQKNRGKFCTRQCYYQWLRENFHGKNHSSWKGGQYTDDRGYVYVMMRDHPRANHRGYVKRSRLVAEKTLGRYLYPNEVPHHRNEEKGDDRPENIKVLASVTHKSFHSKNRKRVAGMNKKSGPTKNMFSACNLVPIINPPFADNKEHLVFRHFSRYLCYPMLKLMKKLRKLIDDPAS